MIDLETIVARIYREHGHDDSWGVRVIYEKQLVERLAEALGEQEESRLLKGRLHYAARMAAAHAELDASCYSQPMREVAAYVAEVFDVFADALVDAGAVEQQPAGEEGLPMPPAPQPFVLKVRRAGE